jgi:hypothetical protein
VTRTARWLAGLPIALSASAATAQGDAPVEPYVRVRLASGADTNVRRDPAASAGGVLLRVDGEATYEAPRRLRLSASGWFEQSTSDADASEGEIQAQASYRRSLAARLALLSVTHAGFRRDRSVFADGQVLTQGAVALDEVGARTFLGAAVVSGRFDLEGGVQGDLAATSGNLEKYTLAGVALAVALRYVPTAHTSLRLRYRHGRQRVDGLTSRNLAGGPEASTVPLGLAAHDLGAGVRTRWRRGLVLVGAYGHARLADDASGYYDGFEHRFRGQAMYAPAPRWLVEASVDLVQREFPSRQPRPTNPRSDTSLDGLITIQADLFPALGVTAHYHVEHARADPTGTLYTRHVFLVGVAGRIGTAPELD